MADNDDDLDLDIDVDDGGDLGGDNGAPGGGKPSLKEIWDNNPMLKVAAIVLGVALAAGSYFVFFGGHEDTGKAVIRLANGADAKQAPGQQELDPAYKKAVEDNNQKAADVAAKTGGSAIPTPTGTMKKAGLDVEEMPEKPKTDPLIEWRKATEARRQEVEKEAPAQAAGSPPPEIPVVQPVRKPAEFHRDPNAAKALSEQMRVIIAAQTPEKADIKVLTSVVSPYKQKITDEEEQKKAQANGLAAGYSGTPGAIGLTGAAGVMPGDCTGSACAAAQNIDQIAQKTIIPAGTIAYGQLINELNSDLQGPVLVQIMSGPFAGGRAIGKIEVKSDFADYMVLTFQTIVLDTVSYHVNAIAMDEQTQLTGQATDVEHHYFTRIVLPAAAKFIEGYGSSMSQTGSQVSQTSGGGQVATSPKPDAKESIYKGVEESTKVIGDMIETQAKRPVTVKIAKGTTMGMFFIDQVTTADAGQ